VNARMMMSFRMLYDCFFVKLEKIFLAMIFRKIMSIRPMDNPAKPAILPSSSQEFSESSRSIITAF
jgi:hypothetical protein